MSAIVYLLPIALTMGLLGLGAFFWALRNHQFDDPEGDANRILFGDAPAQDGNEQPDAHAAAQHEMKENIRHD